MSTVTMQKSMFAKEFLREWPH